MNQSSLFGPTVANVWDASGRRKRGRKPRTGLTSGSNLPPAISAALGDAELYFINGNNEKAIEILSEVSAKAPKLSEPYSILAIIYEQSGDLMKALQLYALTATYTPKSESLHLWSKVAEIASELGELDQAIFALKRCISMSTSPLYYQDKIRIFLRQKNLNNAKATLTKLLTRFKNQEYFLVEYGNLALSVGFKDLAVNSFARYLFHLFGTQNVRTGMFTNIIDKNKPMLAKSNEYILEHAESMNEALYKAVDTLLDKPDSVVMALELIEMVGEWTLAMQAALPPDANANQHYVPELPMLVAIMYAVCKLRLQVDSETDHAVKTLKTALQLVDQGELLPHLLQPPQADSSYGNEIGAEDNYSLEDLVPDLDALRQFTRTAIELAAVGINTRAQKLVVFVEKALTTLCTKYIVLNYKTELHLPNASVAKLKTIVERDIPNIWCSLAGLYESMEASEKALNAYKSALLICADHAVSLRAYAHLSRLEFPREVPHAQALLKAHFDTLVGEFGALRAQQHGALLQDSTTASSTVSAADGTSHSSSAGASAGQESAKKRGYKRKSDITGGTGAAEESTADSRSQALDTLQRALKSHVSQPPALPVEEDGEDGAMEVVEGAVAKGESEMIVDPEEGDLSGEDFEMDLDDNDSDDDLPDDEDVPEGEESGEEEEEEELGEGGQTNRRRPRCRRSSNSSNNNNNNDLDDDAQDQDQRLAQLHWRVANQSKQFTQDDLKYEILALVEWAAMLRDDNCSKQFCLLIVPLLESWAQATTSTTTTTPTATSADDTALSTTENTAANATSSAAGPSATTSATVKLSRKIRNKEAHTVSMYQLALSKIIVGPAGQPSPLLELLDPVEKSCYSLIGALSVAITAEQVLPKDALLTLAVQVRTALEILELPTYGADLLNRAHAKNSESRITGTGRPRAQRIKYVVDFHPTTTSASRASPVALPADDQSGMFSEYAASGKHLNLSTGNNNSRPKVSWNKIGRPTEEPFVSAANRISPQVGLLARQLFDKPDDLSLANLFYREVMTQIDPSKPNGCVELQLPLGRLSLSAHGSVAGQVLAGHDHAMQRKHYLALDKYFTAFCLDPTQPLISLTIGSYLIMLSNHKLTKQRHEVLLKGLTFMHRYLVLRRNALSTKGVKLATSVPPSDSADPDFTNADSDVSGADGTSLEEEPLREVVLYQETLYNLGRAFHDIHLFHLASDQYNAALDLARAYPQLAQEQSTVTRATAHNLVQIYKRSGAVNLAFDVMRQFLVM